MSLLTKEVRKRDLSGSNYFEANVVLDSNRGRAINKDSSHNRDKSNWRSEAKSKDKILYHYCNNLGHIQNFCRLEREINPRRGKIRMTFQLPSNNIQTEKVLGVCGRVRDTQKAHTRGTHIEKTMAGIVLSIDK